MLASRPDIVREDYMTELCLLQVGTCTKGGGREGGRYVVNLRRKVDTVKLSSRTAYSMQSLQQPPASLPWCTHVLLLTLRWRQSTLALLAYCPVLLPCATLYMQDDVPPFPDEVAFDIIRSELGRPLEEIFSSISERPIAAASIGQVCDSGGVSLWMRHDDVLKHISCTQPEPLHTQNVFGNECCACITSPSAAANAA